MTSAGLRCVEVLALSFVTVRSLHYVRLWEDRISAGSAEAATVIGSEAFGYISPWGTVGASLTAS